MNLITFTLSLLYTASGHAHVIISKSTLFNLQVPVTQINASVHSKIAQFSFFPMLIQMQQVVNYAAMIRKNRRIIDGLQQLQHTVDNRKCVQLFARFT